MQTPAPSDTRKRPRSGQCTFQLQAEEAPQTALKKRKAVHISDPQEAAAYQENSSSAIPLERHALRALRRQLIQAKRESRAKQRVRRPATRLAVAKWKRCHQSLEPADTFLENCGHEQYKAIQNFSKHGGPDLWDLRGCQRAASAMSNNPMDRSQASSTPRSPSRRSSKTKPTTTTTTERGSSKSISPYSRSFQQLLVDSHIYPPHYRFPDGHVAPKPGNWDYINEKLAQRRASLSPSRFTKDQYEKFVELDGNAAKEIDVKKEVIPIIRGRIQDPKTASGEIPFTNLAPLTEGENLVPGNPDMYNGARTEQLDRRIRDALGRSVIPSTQHDLPIVPNHVTAVKGPDGSTAVARRQATYDAFFGGRAINALQSYGKEEPQFDGNAYTFSSIYHGGTLKMYTSHPTHPANPGGGPEYHMNHLGSFAMDGSEGAFRTGATWYRNSIDLAKEMRDKAIRDANEIVKRAPITPFASNAGASFASTASQLELDTLTMESQVDETARGVTAEEFAAVESSPDEEEDGGEGEEEQDKLRSSLPLPAKRSSRSRAQGDSRTKRRNRKDSEGTGGTRLSPQETSREASSSAAKKGKGTGKRKLIR